MTPLYFVCDNFALWLAESILWIHFGLLYNVALRGLLEVCILYDYVPIYFLTNSETQKNQRNYEKSAFFFWFGEVRPSWNVTFLML